jgi:predicted secreted Zn-dependent protease
MSKTVEYTFILLGVITVTLTCAVLLGNWIYNRVQDRRLQRVVKTLNAAMEKEKAGNLESANLY